MIHIDRDRRDPSGRAVRPPESWFGLFASAEEQAVQDQGAREARADVYGHEDLRAALHELFHQKCAYCEVSIPNRMGWNVDHYRPKGRIAERPADHPGYYWLAYRWSNLYPACEDCNKRLVDTPTFNDPTTGPAAGKFDQFPLAAESTRAMSHLDDIDGERRLLLDPCSDLPEEHFRFDIEGEILCEPDDPIGETTIRVLNLKRKRLRDNRSRTIEEFSDLHQHYVHLKATGAVALAEGFRSILEKHYLADSAQHAAVARLIDRDPIAFGLTPA